jgi:hypothetical protein
MNRADPIETAVAMLRERYAAADSAFVAGSVMRGEATATSDLDIVVLFAHLERSYRESFVRDGWPIDTFVHDEETIEYYFAEQDRASGVGAIMWMVRDGVPVPAETPLARRVKARANALLEAGPPPLSTTEVEYRRYTITGLLDDLAAPRNDGEARAIVASLYPLLGNLWLRNGGRWGANGKTIPRRLAVADADWARRFDAAFAAAFAGRHETLIGLADEILAPTGGRLFDGYSATSDAAWRRAPPG